MGDRYAKLRAALDTQAKGGSAGYERYLDKATPDSICALLDDYDRLREAAWQMHAMYPYVWDRMDGCLVVFPENVEPFDAAFEALSAALAQEQEEQK